MSKVKAIHALYKGDGNWFDKAIRFVTCSKYSHDELILPDGISYSSSSRDSGARRTRIKYKYGHWDYQVVYIDPVKAKQIFFLHEGKGYDWTGILLSQLFPFGLHEGSKVFCSELIAKMIRKPNSHTYSPKSLCKQLERELCPVQSNLTQAKIDEVFKNG